MCQLVVVEIDGYLRHLHTHYTHLSNAGNHSQRVLNGLHIVVKFAVGLVLTFQGYEFRAYITEIVLYSQRYDPSRQIGGFESLHAMLELRPELVIVLKILVELHHYDAHAGTRVRHRLSLPAPPCM